MVISCWAMGLSSADATNACFSRVVRARRCAGVPLCRCRDALWVLFLPVVFFAAVPLFLVEVAVDPVVLELAPATATAAININSNPATHRKARPEDKNRLLRALIASL